MAGDETDLAVSVTLRHVWTEFAHTGRPRGPDGAAWPECTRDDPRYTLIGDAIEPRDLTANALTAGISTLRESGPARHFRAVRPAGGD
ncbi:hypothetical protein [Amycolatopsis sp. H20-H5]|uniref:hypothetical protein n=1 Tax=Amycolatopsis sp. H20-H5 TaxID=3046309 RepID=UPI002DBD27C1|nr:hypothetical protein [Amycolatopsis sp. H20-H5]MEC3974444.1 hypothetical protein [Amycolatopsis sp. H20-H5]